MGAWEKAGAYLMFGLGAISFLIVAGALLWEVIKWGAYAS